MGARSRHSSRSPPSRCARGGSQGAQGRRRSRRETPRRATRSAETTIRAGEGTRRGRPSSRSSCAVPRRLLLFSMCRLHTLAHGGQKYARLVTSPMRRRRGQTMLVATRARRRTCRRCPAGQTPREPPCRIARIRYRSPLPVMHTPPTFQFGTAVTSTAPGSAGDPSGRTSR
jgi:hypothetical protein